MSKILKEMDKRHMRMALSLATRGTGKVSPNPMVGCVIVGPEGVSGWGYHSEFGGPHAEARALEMAGENAVGATLYVNLEPCLHFGKTPPCVPRIINAGIARVAAGIIDPDPRVNGRGFEALRSAGVQVSDGILGEECRKINRGFLSRIERKRPWVTLKAAASLDGDMALCSGQSKWLTNSMSRNRAHILRDSHDAIMVGVGTVMHDDPRLTVRNVTGRDPRVVVLDPAFRTPAGSRVLNSNCMIYGLSGSFPERKNMLAGKGCLVHELDGDVSGLLPVSCVLESLAAQGVNSLLVEGGPKVLGSFLKERLFDAVSIFFFPGFAGEGKTIGSGFRLESLAEAVGIRFGSVRSVDGDLWVEGTNICLPD
ncbi:MAG: bifunctional diaminohydroxyphosphoribosylaminopyrimidine deaminase/5-amino-6-(5-phosphoribosylamino)uracil reductase RibD [Thermovirgaceae bacterium]|nr:bifunctional diaminohydroxyphosphoribosylaminopyrimidine deaminase/5-amino-6-(5-phosphoribosylamino)uracil reductase RibD [Thermovirgaceae bacterium]